MSSVTAVVKELTLDLSDIPRNKIKQAKDEVRSFLLSEVLRTIGNGKSPVEGESFKKLAKKYAEKEHGGRRLPILELDGDMLEALKTKNLAGSKIEIGIRGSQAPKADGHNQLSDEAKNWASSTDRTQYKRRFIPDDEQNFNKKITKRIDEILGDYREIEQEIDEREDETRTIEPGAVGSNASTTDRQVITIDDFFSDEAIEELLEQALRKRDAR